MHSGAFSRCQWWHRLNLWRVFQKKVQLTCTALFLLWGLLVHLVLPPVVFMYMEGWSYLEGLYYSFITLTTVGFGDYVAGRFHFRLNVIHRVFIKLMLYPLFQA